MNTQTTPRTNATLMRAQRANAERALAAMAIDLAPSITIVPRSQTECTCLYEVQTQSKAGNWIMVLGTNELQGALDFAEYTRNERHATVRVVDNKR